MHTEASLVPQAGIEYRLAHVSVRRFTENEISPQGEEGLGYEIGLGAEFDTNASAVSVAVHVRVLIEAAETGPNELIDSETICTFQLRDLPATTDEGVPKLPRILLASFVGIAVSTTRGVLIGRSRVPELGDFPLPTFSPAQMVDEFVQSAGISWVSNESAKTSA